MSDDGYPDMGDTQKFMTKNLPAINDAMKQAAEREQALIKAAEERDEVDKERTEQWKSIKEHMELQKDVPETVQKILTELEGERAIEVAPRKPKPGLIAVQEEHGERIEDLEKTEETKQNEKDSIWKSVKTYVIISVCGTSGGFLFWAIKTAVETKLGN